MAKYRIMTKVDDCIGCGACATTCPRNWVVEEGKSRPIKVEFDELGCNKSAADGCPVQCIKIVEVK